MKYYIIYMFIYISSLDSSWIWEWTWCRLCHIPLLAGSRDGSSIRLQFLYMYANKDIHYTVCLNWIYDTVYADGIVHEAENEQTLHRLVCTYCWMIRQTSGLFVMALIKFLLYYKLMDSKNLTIMQFVFAWLRNRVSMTIYWALMLNVGIKQLLVVLLMRWCIYMYREKV